MNWLLFDAAFDEMLMNDNYFMRIVYFAVWKKISIEKMQTRVTKKGDQKEMENHDCMCDDQEWRLITESCSGEGGNEIEISGLGKPIDWSTVWPTDGPTERPTDRPTDRPTAADRIRVFDWAN